ncbi:tetratricopeptide repeat protein [Virgibacillus halodenitrificans]|uniref:tetratricopeptide repeat protein n=1 Tax=Virgibacillus halodenitrificans TaxID=1482 RepID=UPI001F236054|nr:tetratricopeptide repeat protein [Virgibacillus halodenitrificans]
MQHHSSNVILFPKWKSVLEEESLQALKEKRYKEALTKLDELISYQVDSHEVMVGKLICLMELGRENEAQEICEGLLQNRDQHYYHYLHVYLTLLFQTNQYQLLMEQVEDEYASGKTPIEMKEQFDQLYNMSKKMQLDVTIDRSTTYMNELEQAVVHKNHAEQWRIIDKLRNIDMQPSEKVIIYLADEEIHPVNKTALFCWLQQSELETAVTINKLGHTVNVVPMDTEQMMEQVFIKEIVLLLRDLEQQNPSMFQLINKLLYRYAYVRYPLSPPPEDIEHIANALIMIGKEYVSIHNLLETDKNDRVNKYIEEIKFFEALYLSIIEE